ncbi:hypothetical protein [Caulobacter segnis]
MIEDLEGLPELPSGSRDFINRDATAALTPDEKFAAEEAEHYAPGTTLTMKQLVAGCRAMHDCQGTGDADALMHRPAQKSWEEPTKPRWAQWIETVAEVYAAIEAATGAENTFPACPTCGAPAGLDCRTIQGRIPPHEERLRVGSGINMQEVGRYLIGHAIQGSVGFEHHGRKCVMVARYVDTPEALPAPPAAPNPVDNYCPWCSEAILPGQPTAMSDGERMHIGCAAEDMDNATFDRDVGG